MDFLQSRCKFSTAKRRGAEEGQGAANLGIYVANNVYRTAFTFLFVGATAVTDGVGEAEHM
jgi:hypothetical protein